MTVQLYVHDFYQGHNSRVNELDWPQTSRSWSLSWLEVGQVSDLAGIILMLWWKLFINSFNLWTSSSLWQRQMSKRGPEETYRRFFRLLLCHFANVAETDHMAEPGGRALQTQKLKINEWTLKLKKKIHDVNNSLRTHWEDFSRVPVVKNLPAMAVDVGSIPGLQRSHIARAAKPVCNYWSPHTLEPMVCNERSHSSEKPARRN